MLTSRCPMDVTCERCGTEYEFDETLVSDRGTTVKCTNCGHLFKVYPPGAEPGGGDRDWIVRKKDGSEERLESLKALQQRITAGAVAEDEELSRSGEAWKRLGDIAELATFFRAAEAARVAASSPPPAAGADATVPDTAPRKRTLFGVGAAPSVPAPPAPPSAPPPSAPPPAARSRRPPPPSQRPPPKPSGPLRAPTQAHGGAGESDETARPATGTPATDSTARPGGAPPDATARPAGRPPKPAPPKPAPAKATPAPAPSRPAPPKPAPTPPAATAPGTPARRKKALYLDDDEERPIAPPKKSRVGLWVTLILLLAGGIGVALQWDVVGPALGLGGGDPAEGFLAAGDAALARGSEEGFAEAIEEYTRASAHDERDPRVLVALSRAHAAWAQALRFQAADLEARAVDDPSRAGEAARVRAEAEEHAEAAMRHAEEMGRMHPANPEAELVLADAARLGGDLDEAQRHLDRASEMFEEPTAEFHLVRALLAADQAGDPAAAKDSAAAAVAADGGLLRARLVLARAELAGRDVAAARRALEAVLEAEADQPRARALLRAIDEGLPPAPPVVELGDAGLADAGTEGASEPSEPSEPGEAPTRDDGRDDARDDGAEGRTPDRTERPAGAPPRGRDYSWYIRQGDALLERGNPSDAEEHYEAAMEIRPGGVEAMTGLGYVALNQGRAAEAARYFRPAARADYGEAYIGLGDAYRRMGRREDALQTYRAYLASRPNGTQASIARRQVAALEAEVGGAASSMDTPDDGDDEGGPETESATTPSAGSGGAASATMEAAPEPAPEAATPEPAAPE
ncbi:MAG TPA: tetratricopeptide repeat protein, partial [Polyangiaceae bacterium LLY-WYZ-15_(1-7)]|nr:tetratricopeptide repeat protein [Polyangiaceae bacterium LLY-WYZ-15_(1-7)]